MDGINVADPGIDARDGVLNQPPVQVIDVPEPVTDRPDLAHVMVKDQLRSIGLPVCDQSVT